MPATASEEEDMMLHKSGIEARIRPVAQARLLGLT